MKSLPAYVEGEKPRWRHPVFGDRDVWVDQRPDPVFYRTIQPHTYKARVAADQILEDIARKLEARR